MIFYNLYEVIDGLSYIHFSTEEGDHLMPHSAMQKGKTTFTFEYCIHLVYYQSVNKNHLPSNIAY